MKISELVAKITGLEARATEAFKAELAELKATVTGTMEQLRADLATAQASIASLGNDKAGLEASVSELTAKLSEANKESLAFNDALTDACLNGKLLDLHLAADATPEQARAAALALPITEKFKAYQGALNAAFAKASLPNTTLPAAPVTAPATGRQVNTIKRAEYFKLSPREQLAAVKSGVIITD